MKPSRHKSGRGVPRDGRNQAASPPRTLAPAQLGQFARYCADLLLGASADSICVSLVSLFATLCNLRSTVITRFALGVPPRTLFHNIDDDAVVATIDVYEKGPFKLDPFFIGCVIDRRRGVFRLGDIAPDNFSRTSYFLDFYRRLHMGEEVGLIMPLLDGAGVVISLESGAPDGRFKDIELQWLHAIYPLVAAVASRHWNERAEVPDSGTRSIASLFSGFGKGVLSNRECEVVRLILQGHSSASIAAQLGIAAGTVKMHRKHAYQKLAVSSQAQLFQRFMATIASS
jgi:DNA-binding CsgD family transcriptional regulator